ncbi:hypothetical protein N665_0004s0096 [Sinapis alba]|nr:hypothetical protein N665_0004s0096 [Sinapis alba]
MDSNSYLNLNFVDLLQSQQDSNIGLESSPIPLSSTQATKASKFQQDTPVERKERRSWSPTDDVVLISSWLNTSKDVVVGNEQKSGRELQTTSLLELRHDQKWCNLFTKRTSKKRKYEDGAQSSTSHATGEADEGTARSPGVKAAKSRGKKPLEEKKGLSEFEQMWSIKQEDLSRKERMSKLGLLDRLLAKAEPLSEYEYEECLKKKLINELFST